MKIEINLTRDENDAILEMLDNNLTLEQYIRGIARGYIRQKKVEIATKAVDEEMKMM